MNFDPDDAFEKDLWTNMGEIIDVVLGLVVIGALCVGGYFLVQFI